MIDFDANIFGNKINEIKQAPFENHPLNNETNQIKDMYLTILCAVGKFGDDGIASNNHILKVVSSVKEASSVDEYAEKTSSINGEFVNNLSSLFIPNDIKYTLFLDMLMIKGNCQITNVSNGNKATKFISDIAMLLQIDDTKKSLITKLSQSFLGKDKSNNCVKILNSLCQTIDYNRYFKCYSKEYDIEEVFIIKKELEINYSNYTKFIIETIKGFEITFNFDDYYASIFAFKNAKFDISKCNFNFRNDYFYSLIEFENCEFYSSDILSKDAIAIINHDHHIWGDNHKIIFKNCTFNYIQFDINKKLSLINNSHGVYTTKIEFENCYFDNISNFYTFIKYGNHCDYSKITISNSNFCELEGYELISEKSNSEYFYSNLVYLQCVKIDNSILNRIAPQKIREYHSILNYKQPEEKDLTSSILSSLI